MVILQKKYRNICNAKLAEDSMTVRNIIRKSNVKVICTTDDPIDSLEWHKKIAADETVDFKVYPAWRPDKAMNIEKPDFLEYVQKLACVSGIEVDSVKSLLAAIDNRMEFFDSMKCCVSDHGLNYVCISRQARKQLRQSSRRRLTVKS